MPTALSIADFGAIVREFAAQAWPGEWPKKIQIVMASGEVGEISLIGVPQRIYPPDVHASVHAAGDLAGPSPGATPAGAPSLDVPSPWQPDEFQAKILTALEFRALRSDPLGDEVGNRRQLYRHPGGIQELRERGLVALSRKYGYYRPDAPPEELVDAPSDNGMLPPAVPQKIHKS